MANIEINPGLKTTLDTIQGDVYNIDGSSLPGQNLKMTVIPKPGTKDTVTINVSFDLQKTEFIKSKITFTEEEWEKLKDKVCFWDFVEGTNNIANHNNPTLKFTPTAPTNDTLHQASLSFYISKGKIGGGSNKIGGGSGTLDGVSKSTEEKYGQL